MKVLLATNWFFPMIGGGEIVSKKIATHLSLNHEVFVLTRKLTNRDSSVLKPLKIIEYIPAQFDVVKKQIDKISPDVILIYSDVFDYFRHIISAGFRSKIIVATCGSNWAYSNQNFMSILYRNQSSISNFICHSKYDRDFKLCDSAFKKKTVIIPNGVDIEEFDQNQYTREKLFPKQLGKKWILNVSNFFPGKGQHHLVDILNRLPNPENLLYIQVCSKITFPVAETLEHNWKRAVALNLDKRIETQFLKDIDRSKVIGLFKNSNIFGFTSEKEVFPLVLLEAMCAELPWVATDVGNARGLGGGKFIASVKNRDGYSIFDDRVKNLFAKSIIECLELPVIGQDGRKQIENELRWDKILPLYSNIIENA